MGQYEEESSQVSDNTVLASDGEEEDDSHTRKKPRNSIITSLLPNSDEDLTQEGEHQRPTSSSTTVKAEEITPFPPSVGRSTSTVPAVSAVKIKSEPKTEPVADVPAARRGVTNQAESIVRVTPTKEEKRDGVWMSGLLVSLEDTERCKLINNNIAKAIGEYLDRLEAKLNWVTTTHDGMFWYGGYDHISALKNLQKQLVCTKLRVDVLNERTMKRAFPCMEMEGTFTWFKSFMTMFGKKYELEPLCNLTTLKYTVQMVWVRELDTN